MHCRFRVQQCFGRFLAGFTILAVQWLFVCCTTAIVLVCVQGKANILGMPYSYSIFISALLVDYYFNYLCLHCIYCSAGTTFNAIISAVAIGIAYPFYVSTYYYGKFICFQVLHWRIYDYFNSRLSVYGVVCSCVFIAYTSQGITMSADMIAFCLVGVYYRCYDCCIMAIVSGQKK